VGVEFQQKPDHPSTFMKMVKERTRTMSTANDVRRQFLPSKVIWDGTVDRFEVFRNNVEGNYGQIGAGYLFDSSFQVQETYLERVVECYVDLLDEVGSASQIEKITRALYDTLYGTLLSACHSGVGRKILMTKRDKQVGIRSWCQLVKQYEIVGKRNVRIKRLESVIKTLFNRNYMGRTC
jgi:hypothetical protein